MKNLVWFVDSESDKLSLNCSNRSLLHYTLFNIILAANELVETRDFQDVTNSITTILNCNPILSITM